MGRFATQRVSDQYSPSTNLGWGTAHVGAELGYQDLFKETALVFVRTKKTIAGSHLFHKQHGC